MARTYKKYTQPSTWSEITGNGNGNGNGTTHESMHSVTEIVPGNGNDKVQTSELTEETAMHGAAPPLGSGGSDSSGGGGGGNGGGNDNNGDKEYHAHSTYDNMTRKQKKALEKQKNISNREQYIAKYESGL